MQRLVETWLDALRGRGNTTELINLTSMVALLRSQKDPSEGSALLEHALSTSHDAAFRKQCAKWLTLLNLAVPPTERDKWDSFSEEQPLESALSLLRQRLPHPGRGWQAMVTTLGLNPRQLAYSMSAAHWLRLPGLDDVKVRLLRYRSRSNLILALTAVAVICLMVGLEADHGWVWVGGLSTLLIPGLAAWWFDASKPRLEMGMVADELPLEEGRTRRIRAVDAQRTVHVLECSDDYLRPGDPVVFLLPSNKVV